MAEWVEQWGSTIALLTTLLLLGVTAWYAALTRSLAKSAKESAVSARLAAEQSAAAIDVNFTVRPSYVPEVVEVSAGDELHEDEHELVFGVDISSAGATVYVHKITLDYAALVALGKTWDQMVHVAHEIAGTELVPLDGVVLPTRIHRDEEIRLALPDGKATRATVVGFQVTVAYSLNGLGEGIPRRVKWIGVQGEDF